MLAVVGFLGSSVLKVKSADLVDLEYFGLDPDDDLVELAESVEDAVAPGLDLEHAIVLDLESQIYSLDLGTL